MIFTKKTNKSKKKNKQELNSELAKIREEANELILKRFAISAIFLLIFSSLISIAVDKNAIFYPPSDILNSTKLVQWFAMNMFIPYSLLFFVSLFMSWYILSHQSFTYMRWLWGKTAFPIIINYFMVVTSIVLLLALTIPNLPDNNFFVNSMYGLTKAEGYLWNAMLIFITIPLWFGYKTGWKSYKEVGASTVQELYEEDIRELEKDTTGQFWDKYIVNFYQKISGSDGKKPRGGFTWVTVGTVLNITLWSLFVVNGYYYLAGISIFFILPLILLAIMTFAKWSDTRMVKRAPILNSVRGPDNEGTYNPGSVGIRVFNRKR